MQQYQHEQLHSSLMASSLQSPGSLVSAVLLEVVQVLEEVLDVLRWETKVKRDLRELH